jgi:hypothetical protein
MSTEYLKRLDQLEEARKKHLESEWLLKFLRTEGSEPKTKTKEEILIWSQNLATT